MFAAWPPPPLFIPDIKNIWRIQDSKVYCQNLYQMCALVSTWRLIIFMWIKCFKSNSSFQLFRIGNFSGWSFVDTAGRRQMPRCFAIVGWLQTKRRQNAKMGKMPTSRWVKWERKMAIGCGERERVFCSFCAKKSFCGCQFCWYERGTKYHNATKLFYKFEDQELPDLFDVRT